MGDIQITNAVKAKLASWNIKSYDDFIKSSGMSVSIFSNDVKTEAQKKKAYEEYSEQILLQHYDVNHDGKVTTEEFAKVEENGSLDVNKVSRQHDENIGITASSDDIANDDRIANRTGNLFAKNLDVNSDGIISKEELAFFEKNADEIDGNADGVITSAGESGMFGAVTGMNASDKNINAVVNKYLMGQTLTAEEQKILEQSSVKIKNNMKNAMGE